MISARVIDPSAARAAALLAAVLERSPRSLKDLAELAGLTLGEADPLIAALELHGLVARDATGLHVDTGPAARRFAGRTGDADLAGLAVAPLAESSLAAHAEPALRLLAEESGETANLFALRSGHVSAVAQVDGRHLLGATNWIGRELPLHATAAGKVFLAFGAASLPAADLERFTPATVCDRRRLERELEAVRDQGYAAIIDELEVGLSAVAAPVRDRAGDLVAALTASGASLRLAPQRLRRLGRATLEQAHALSTRLGHRVPLERYLDARVRLG